MINSRAINLIKEEIGQYNQSYLGEIQRNSFLLRFNEDSVFIDKEENGIVKKYLEISWQDQFSTSEFYLFSEMTSSYEKLAFHMEEFCFEILISNIVR